MSTGSFQLSYDGPAVRDGSMDVQELAPALLSLGDLVRNTNYFLNQDRAQVSVQVQSNFQRGSFEIWLVLNQVVVEHAPQVLFPGGLAEAKQLLELLFGHKLVSGGVIVGVFQLYKMLKGKRPEPRSIKQGDNSTLIINDIRVEGRTAELYLNDGIRSRVDRVAAPLGKKGFEKLRVVRDNEVVNELLREDVPAQIEDGEAELERTLVNTNEALLTVVTANFEKGKWKFSDGTAKFNAEMNDTEFKQRLDNHQEGFYKGDVLRVRMTITQMASPNGNLQARYSIDRVLEHRHAMRQEPLVSRRRRALADSSE